LTTDAAIPPGPPVDAAALDAATPLPDAAQPEGGTTITPPPGGTAGCNGEAPRLREQTSFLMSGGRLRTAGIHLPPQYDGRTPLPVVMYFHGYLSTSLLDRFLNRLGAASDEHGFILVEPSGIDMSWNGGECCGVAWGPTPPDDVQFAREVLDEVEASYCVDKSKLFVTGMSNGGFMAQRVACVLSDRIAGVATVAGQLGIPHAECVPARKIPFIEFHGTDDSLVPYEGGRPLDLEIGLDFPSTAETMAFWRTHNGCSETTSVTYTNAEVTCVEWAGCDPAAPTQLCTIEGGGHNWPGGPALGIAPGRGTMAIDASQHIAEFFGLAGGT
jgi:polyhydroxybutyrate depolymerase